MRHILLTLVLAAIVFGSVPNANGNPSNANPRAIMPVHNTQLSGAVLADATKHYNQAAAIIDGIVKLQQMNRLATVKPNDWVRGYTHLGYLRNRARQLELYGETTGYDLSRRHFHLSGTFNTLLNAYKQLPQHVSIQSKIGASLPRYDKALQRDKNIVTTHMKAGELNKAWEALLKAQYETLAEPNSLLTAAPPRYAVIGAFTTEADITAAWKKRGDEALVAQRDANLPKYDELLKQLGAAARGVGSSGNAEINGQMVPGPAVIRQCHDLWRQTHVGTLRASYVEFARSELNGDAAPNYRNMVAAYEKFCSDYAGRVAAIITADATRVPESDAVALHAAYVAAVAPLFAELQSETLREPLAKALANFELKSPTVAEEVAAYRAATGEHLRWMKRAAAAEAKKAAESVRPVHEQLQAKPAVFHPRYPGAAELREEAPILIQAIAPLVLQKPASIASGAKATPQAQTMIGRYHHRVYTIAADASEWVAPHQQRLRDALFVDATHPPRTVEAAAAITSLASAQFNQAGGIVTGCHIESLTTRLATLPVGAYPFAALGPFEVEKTGEVPPLKQLIVRCDFQPKWIATPYVFVQAP